MYLTLYKNVHNLTRIKETSKRTNAHYYYNYCTLCLMYIYDWARLSSQAESEMGELAVQWKKCPDFQHIFTPFYTSDVYDTYMDGCILMLADYISNPNVIIVYVLEEIVV